MKKIVLFLLLALMSVNVRAQEKLPYDEELLLGHFTSYSSSLPMEVKGTEGIFGKLTDIYLNANDYSYIICKSDNNIYRYIFSTFFISNGDKLHLVPDFNSNWTCPYVTFVITMFQTDPTTEGQNILFLRLMGSASQQDYMYRSVSESANVNSIIQNSDESKKYDIRGLQSDGKYGVYIQNGKKHIAK